MKDVFFQVFPDKHEAIVGTTKEYGLLLETRINRSFLRRTLNEMFPILKKILIKGPALPGQQ
jgi:hypothetical protein